MYVYVYVYDGEGLSLSSSRSIRAMLISWYTIRIYKPPPSLKNPSISLCIYELFAAPPRPISRNRWFIYFVVQKFQNGIIYVNKDATERCCVSLKSIGWIFPLYAFVLFTYTHTHTHRNYSAWLVVRSSSKNIIHVVL